MYAKLKKIWMRKGSTLSTFNLHLNSFIYFFNFFFFLHYPFSVLEVWNFEYPSISFQAASEIYALIYTCYQKEMWLCESESGEIEYHKDAKLFKPWMVEVLKKCRTRQRKENITSTWVQPCTTEIVGYCSLILSYWYEMTRLASTSISI